MPEKLCDRCELMRGDALYPPLVAALPDAPPTLYVRGDPRVLTSPCISIVGSRRATPYGEAVAEMVARIAAESGITVVSGGALGVDQVAGTAALDAGGRHVVVLGCGADVVYPESSRPLIDRVLSSGGAVVSLDHWGMDPRRWSFPRRNRVIAGLSLATVVTEAAMPSGTFTTAEAATELDRELLVLPGSILSPESAGSNYLISVGATMIVDEESIEVAISRIYGTLRFCRPAPRGNSGLNAREQRVLKNLVASPMRLDDLACSLGLGAQECLMVLSVMELNGFVEQTMDGRFSASKSALHALTALG